MFFIEWLVRMDVKRHVKSSPERRYGADTLSIFNGEDGGGGDRGCGCCVVFMDGNEEEEPGGAAAAAVVVLPLLLPPPSTRVVGVGARSAAAAAPRAISNSAELKIDLEGGVGDCEGVLLPALSLSIGLDDN